MPKYTTKEFGELCGMSAGQVRVAITRDKKVVKGADDLIDSENVVNKLFFEKRTVLMNRKAAKGGAGSGERGAEGDERVQEEVHTSDKKSGKAATKSGGEKKSGNKTEGGIGLAAEIEKSKLELARLEVQRKTIDLDKKMGNSLPVELFMMVIKQYNQTNVKGFQQALLRVINRIGLKYKMSAADQADIRKMVVEEINKTSKETIVEVKTKVKDMVLDYSQTRGVGERG